MTGLLRCCSAIFPFLPDQASTHAPSVDDLYFALLAVAAFFVFLIFGLIIFFSIKYRRSNSSADRVIRRTDFLKLELSWILIPLAISIGIFVWAARLYFVIEEPPKDAMDIYVVGKQWMWKIQHPEGVREINELHVPVGRTIKLIMTSQDVIHSFYVPAFRVKQDVLPGRYTTEWFQPTKVGEYHLFCAEYCGTSHSGMVGRIVVMEPQEYAKWLNSGGGSPMANSGEALFQQAGCASCHPPGSGNRGPSLTGLFGSKVTLSDGRTVTADIDYIRESIVDPRAKITKGYQPIMPTTYRSQLTQEQIGQLIEFIRSLGSNARQATGGGK